MVAILQAPPPRAAAVKRRWPLRRMLWIVTAVIALPVAAEAYTVMFGANFHTVVPGRIYRCAQPSAQSLDTMIAEHGIRTIVNLRGPCDPFDWYLDEARAAHDHNVGLEDIGFSAGRLPPVAEVRRLITVLEHAEYPILLHCRRGADRTGLAAAIAMLLTGDAPLESASAQLGLRFGHVAVGRPAQLDQFLEFYKAWLDAENKNHTSENFRHWALDCYCPGSCWCELTFAKTPVATVSAKDPVAFYLHARNASLLPWVLKPEWLAGVHLGCHVYDEEDRLIDVAKAGLLDATVRPGEAIDLTLVLSPLHKSGRYRLQMDMVDEQQCWFYQTGSQPLEVELIVRE